MKVYRLKKITLPKVAVLATGLAAALLVATVAPMPAQAEPGYKQNCAGCHNGGGSITATPSTATPLANANYTVSFGKTVDGYWISGTGVSLSGGSASSVTVKAPATAGAYTYTVHVRDGDAAQTTYRITVAPIAPPTTVPPTVPPTTVPPTTPPTTVPPTTPPTTVPPTTPPTTVPPTTPPTAPSTARIFRLSDSSADSGDRITISGTGFGQAGVVKFGSVTAYVSSWSTTRISVRVPREGRSSRVSVTVTPKDGTASNGISFRYDDDRDDDDRDDDDRDDDDRDNDDD